jgi:hypothetical protein
MVFLLTFGTHGTILLCSSCARVILSCSAGSITPISVATAFISNVALYAVVFWMSRISLALSIARVFPTGTVARKSLVGMAVFFLGLSVFDGVFVAAFCLSGDPPDIAPVAEYRNCQPGTLRYVVAGAVISVCASAVLSLWFSQGIDLHVVLQPHFCQISWVPLCPSCFYGGSLFRQRKGVWCTEPYLRVSSLL